MSQPPSSTPSARRPRVDAQRNRERILAVAREAFTRLGADATLDEIARRAEVGPGTLYRHFPTREALIEEVYRSSVEELTAAAQHYTQTLSPFDALRTWMLLFIDHVANKLLIMPLMETVPGGSLGLIEGTRSQIHSTFRGLVQRAVESGALRHGTDPDDIVRALIGIFHTTAIPGWEASARRLVDMLLEGARTVHHPREQPDTRA